MISEVAENWPRLDRMAAIDRNIRTTRGIRDAVLPRSPRQSHGSTKLLRDWRSGTAPPNRAGSSTASSTACCNEPSSEAEAEPDETSRGTAVWSIQDQPTLSRRRMKPRTHKTTARVTSSLDRHRIGGGTVARAHDTFRRGLLSLRSGHRRGPRGLGGSWRSRIMTTSRPWRWPVPRQHAGASSSLRGRADLRVQEPRDPHPRSFHPRRRPEASGRNGGTRRRPNHPAEGNGRAARRPGGFRSTCLPSSGLFPERSWDSGTWPIFCAHRPGEKPARRSLAISGTDAPPAPQNPGSTPPRASTP